MDGDAGVGGELGAEQWRFETGSYVKSSPTVADGTVYVGSGDRNLYAVDAATPGAPTPSSEASTDLADVVIAGGVLLALTWGAYRLFGRSGGDDGPDTSSVNPGPLAGTGEGAASDSVGEKS